LNQNLITINDTPDKIGGLRLAVARVALDYLSHNLNMPWTTGQQV